MEKRNVGQLETLYTLHTLHTGTQSTQAQGQVHCIIHVQSVYNGRCTMVGVQWSVSNKHLF